MEAQAWYGKKQTQPSSTGYWKKTGPGLREQLRDSWIEYYNGALTVERLKNYLMDIFFSRVDEQNRKVVAMTGTLGLTSMAPSMSNHSRKISLIAGTSLAVAA
jgi:hypothetical protein